MNCKICHDDKKTWMYPHGKKGPIKVPCPKCKPGAYKRAVKRAIKKGIA